MKLEKASDKEGRDSWLVNWLFGKREEAVALMKLTLEAATEEMGFGLETSVKLRKGAGQHP